MKEHDLGLIGASKWAASAIAAYWLAAPLVLRMLAIFMGLDFATGIVAAASRGELASDISVRGLAKKGMIVLAVLFSHVLEQFALHSLPEFMQIPSPDLGLEKIFAIYFCVNESISITENLGRGGVKLPRVLVQWLVKLKAAVPEPATQAEIDGLEGDVAE